MIGAAIQPERDVHGCRRRRHRTARLPRGRRGLRHQGDRRPRSRAHRLATPRERRRGLHHQPGAGGAGPRVARAPRGIRRPGARGRRQQRLRQRLHRRRRPARTRARWPRAPATAVECDPSAVLVASTGVIGVKLPMAKVRRASLTPRRALARRRRRRGARDHDDRSVPEGSRGRGVTPAAGRSASAAWPRAPA